MSKSMSETKIQCLFCTKSTDRAWKSLENTISGVELKIFQSLSYIFGNPLTSRVVGFNPDPNLKCKLWWLP